MLQAGGGWIYMIPLVFLFALEQVSSGLETGGGKGRRELLGRPAPQRGWAPPIPHRVPATMSRSVLAEAVDDQLDGAGLLHQVL